MTNTHTHTHIHHNYDIETIINQGPSQFGTQNNLSNDENHFKDLDKLIKDQLDEASWLVEKKVMMGKIRKELDKHGMVTIVGNSGEGKTSLAFLTLREFQFEGHQIHRISQIEHLQHPKPSEKAHVYFIDGAFSCQFKVDSWRKEIQWLRDLLNQRKVYLIMVSLSSDLLDFRLEQKDELHTVSMESSTDGELIGIIKANINRGNYDNETKFLLTGEASKLVEYLNSKDLPTTPEMFRRLGLKEFASLPFNPTQSNPVKWMSLFISDFKRSTPLIFDRMSNYQHICLCLLIFHPIYNPLQEREDIDSIIIQMWVGMQTNITTNVLFEAFNLLQPSFTKINYGSYSISHDSIQSGYLSWMIGKPKQFSIIMENISLPILLSKFGSVTFCELPEFYWGTLKRRLSSYPVDILVEEFLANRCSLKAFEFFSKDMNLQQSVQRCIDFCSSFVNNPYEDIVDVKHFVNSVNLLNQLYHSGKLSLQQKEFLYKTVTSSKPICPFDLHSSQFFYSFILDDEEKIEIFYNHLFNGNFLDLKQFNGIVLETPPQIKCQIEQITTEIVNFWRYFQYCHKFSSNIEKEQILQILQTMSFNYNFEIDWEYESQEFYIDKNGNQWYTPTIMMKGAKYFFDNRFKEEEEKE